MGNNVTKTMDKWGIHPRKLSIKRTKRKDPPAVRNHQGSGHSHIYDSVKAEPQYAQVNKRPKRDVDDGLHYADIQVIQPRYTSRGWQTPSHHSTTEYASIDFNTPVNIQTPAKPADLFIPPGELKRPNVRSSRKKTDSSR